MSCNCCPPVIFGQGTPGLAGPEGPAGPEGAEGPPGELPAIATACGITGDATDTAPLAAATSGTWGAGPLAFACPDDTSGTPVYCDSAGELRTAPPTPVQGFSQFSQETVGGPPGEAGSALPLHDVILTVTNPSNCRTMTVATRLNVNGIAFTQTAGNDWSIDFGLAFSTDGTDPTAPDPITGLLRRRTPADLASPEEFWFPVVDAPLSAGVFGYVAPGETIKVRCALSIRFHAVNPAAGADGTAPGWRVREMGLYTWGLTT